MEQLAAQLADLETFILQTMGHNHSEKCEEPELDVDDLLKPWRTGHSEFAHAIVNQAVLLNGEYADQAVLLLAAQCALTTEALDFLLAASGVGDNRRIAPTLNILREAHVMCAERRSWPEFMAGRFGILINSNSAMRTVKLSHSLLTLTHVTALTQLINDEKPILGCGGHTDHTHQCAIDRAAIAMVASTKDLPGTDNREAAGGPEEPSPADRPSPFSNNPARTDEGTNKDLVGASAEG